MNTLDRLLLWAIRKRIPEVASGIDIHIDDIERQSRQARDALSLAIIDAKRDNILRLPDNGGRTLL